MHLLTADHFNVSWWRLDLSYIRLPKNLKLQNPTAITLNSISTREFKKVKEWCDTNGNFKIYSPGYWTETLHFNIGIDNDVEIEFSNNERTILAELDDIEKLEKFLELFPKKTHAVLVEMDAVELRKLVRGYDVRIIKDRIIPDQKIILLDNNELAVELILKCD